MKQILFWVAFFVCGLAVLCWGMLTLFSPETLRKLLQWYTRADRWSSSVDDAQKQGVLSRLLGGLFTTVVAAMMLRLAVLRLLTWPPQVRTHPVPAAVPAPGYHLSGLLGGLLIIVFGLYMVARPRAWLRLIQANFPGRRLSNETTRRSLWPGRVLGALIVLFGGFALFLWYTHTH